MAIDVLFINPGNRTQVYQSLGDEFSAVDVPIWALLCASYLRNRNRTVALYDANAEGWTSSIAKKLIEQYQPKLITVLVFGNHPSASTQTMLAARLIIADVKAAEPDIPIAIGGTHPSALPERTLKEEKADFVIQGEGPRTIEGLLAMLDGTCSRKSVQGLWWLDDNTPQFSTAASLITDLDAEIPGYAWDLLGGMGLYRAHNWHCFQEFSKSQKPDFSDVRAPYASIYTSLGCPYRCSFCCINALFEKPGIRYWSLNKVLETIDTLHNRYGVRNIRFADELFIFDPKRVDRFCDMMIERNYNLNIWVYGRVDTTKPQLLKKLRAAGITWIALGIESANEAVQSGVNKVLHADICDVVRSIQNAGINVIGNYMFGLPEDTFETMEQTLMLALELCCEFFNMYSVMAYPGSKLYREAVKTGSVLPDTWDGFSQHSWKTKPLPTKTLSAQDVLRFRDQAFLRVVTDSAYRDRIRGKFGERVIDHLDRMIRMPIKRRILELV